MKRLINYGMTIFLLLVFASTPVSAQLKSDHINFVVSNLAEYKTLFNNLGFVLKPGTKHSNGIENFFIKFPTGPYIEILSVVKPKDNIARFYGNLQQKGQIEPAFLALSAAPIILDSLQNFFADINQPTSFSDLGFARILSFQLSEKYLPYFFIEYSDQSPEAKKFVTHNNGATKISRIFINFSFNECLKTNFPFNQPDDNYLHSGDHPENNFIGIEIFCRSLLYIKKCLLNSKIKFTSSRKMIKFYLSEKFFIQFVEE